MNAFIRYAAILGLTLLSAQAQAIEFSFVSGAVVPDAYGNVYTTTVDGLTLTASAWSSTGKRGAFETAELEIDSGSGLGVCNRDEKINCADKKNSQALDNKGANDLILFDFSSAVSLQSLTTYQAGKDSDLSLWAGTGTFSPDGMTSSAFGTAVQTGDLSTFTGSYDWLAVAARIGDKDDFVKLQSLTVTPVTQAVPDAATWMTMLAGLGLVGFAVNRRSRT
ncbi:MAG TPA: PEP-CTERM sorting domain-containing protein [Thiobacillus sp.]|nr:PEP-CTERM sorting domain-containing protein [Thiobacillus sp.]